MKLSKINKKVVYEDSRMTLTAIHNKKIKEFNDKLSELPEKKKTLSALKKRHKITRNNNDLFQIKKQMEELNKEIYNIENRIDFSEYEVNALNFLSQYKESTNKGQISKNYIQECLGESLIPSTSKDLLKCELCNINRIVNHKEAVAICSECGSVVNYQDTDNCTEFSGEIEVLSQFSYKRTNHFKEWISMLLARESSSPPDDVIDQLLLELKKNRIYDRDLITPERIREYLRKLGLHRMYEHIPLIIYKITGIPPPKISRELENQLIKMFEEIQGPFEKHKPPERKNFLSYSYCIYKFCQLLGQNHVLKHLSLIKNREKLHMQDKLFEKICKDLGWEFIPSL